MPLAVVPPGVTLSTTATEPEATVPPATSPA
jgi:hypothetical protein